VLLGQREAKDDWDVRFTGFSLNQTKVAEGEVDVWDDPEMAPARLAVEVGIAVRDRWPDAFPQLHWSLFAARHDRGLDIRERSVVASLLDAVGLDAAAVMADVDSCRPRDTFRAEHEAAVRDHKVFGVPTVTVDGHAVFVRLMDRPGDDATYARQTVDRVIDLATGWANLNELKHTSIPH
jgi:protein-disulfide isomerase-like protein with CxxC motif